MSRSDANGLSSAHAGHAKAVPPAAAAANGDAKGRLRPRDARQMRLTQSFAQVVAVLMRDPNYRALPIGDLEWLALPPLMAGQFRIGQTRAGGGKAQSEQDGILVPVTVALWARVSDELDAALSGTLDRQVRLKPDQWASGNNLWLMAIGGDPRIVPRFLAELQGREFKGQMVKIRVHDRDGKVAIRTLEDIAASAAAARGQAAPAAPTPT